MRTALVVGINAYPSGAELEGCVPDALAWGAYFQKRGFEVVALLDRDATKANLLAALRGMVQGAKAGDILAFMYSGHGTQVRDRNLDEPDGYDEALVPVDYQDGQLLIDDDLRAVFDTLPPRVTLTTFLDCCYSGTGTRLLGVNPVERPRAGARARYLRLAPDEVQAYMTSRATEGALAPRPLSPEDMNHATLSACTPYEVAYEVNGRGVFSVEALKVLESSGSTLTLAGLLKRILQNMGPHRWQTPTLDAPKAMHRQTIVRNTR